MKRARTGYRRYGGISITALPRHRVTSPDQLVTERVYLNLEVISNTVVNCGYTPIVVKNVSGVRVENNTIQNPLNSPAEVLASLDFSATGYDLGFNSGIYYDNTTDCTAFGNRFIDMNGIQTEYFGPDNPGALFSATNRVGFLFQIHSR
jgi:hypothetical protein